MKKSKMNQKFIKKDGFSAHLSIKATIFVRAANLKITHMLFYRSQEEGSKCRAKFRL